MSESNVKVIQAIYGAFGRGDVAGVQEHVAERTRWDFDVSESQVPWHSPVTSRAEVPRFLGALVENLAMETFEPLDLMACREHVIAHIRIAYTVKRTGRRVAMDQLHWWSLDGGKVVRLRHYEDTAQVKAAWG